MSVCTKNRLGLAALAAVAGMMGYAARSDAAVRTWDGGGADDNVNTAGNWVNNTLPVLNAGSGTTADDWVFTGTTRLNPFINVFPANLAQSITFDANAGAFTLSNGTSTTQMGNTSGQANGGGHIINNSTNVQTINANIASRFGNIQANTADIVINGNWLIGNLGGIGSPPNQVNSRTNNFSGQANITLNGALSSSGRLLKQGTGTLTVNSDAIDFFGGARIDAGAIRITSQAALGASDQIVVTGNAAGSGRLELSGGTNGGVVFSAAKPVTFEGRQGAVSALPHLVNVDGNNTWQAPVNFTTGGGEYTIRAAGGSLNITGAITSGLAGIRTLYLDGDAGTGEASGGIQNTGGGTLPVVKNGTGTWTLSGGNTFNGDLTVNAGTLIISGNNTTSAPARVNGGTLKLMSTSSLFVPSITLTSASSNLDVTDFAAGGGYTLPGFTQLNGVGRVKGQVSVGSGSQMSVGSIVSPGTLTFENGLSLTGGGIYNAFFNGTNHSVIDVTGGTLSTAGTNDIKVVGAGLSVGQYPLLKYVGTLGGDGFAGFNLAQLPPRTIAALLNNTGAKTIDLNITGVDAPKWTGANGNVWDINNAQNWREIVSGNATTYLEASQPGDSVLFDDSATGSTTIDLQVPVSPALVTANNSTAKDYVITGSGNINGTASLIKNGNGLFVIANANSNSYSGGTIINAGTLQIGDAGGFFGDVGTGPVTVNAGGTFKVNRNDDVELGNVLTGSGAIRKTGTGLLTLAGANQNYSGVITVEQGTLRGTGQVNLGSSNAAIVVLDGATFDTNFVQVGAKTVTVTGAGVNGAGAIVNNGGGQNNSLERVVLAGDTTFGGSGRWDIRNLGGTTHLLTGGNAYNLTKVGGNQVNLVNVTVDPALGDVNVNEGIFGIEVGTTGLGDPNKTLTIASSAIFQLFNLTNPLDKKIVSNGGQIQAASGAANAVAGPVTLNADTTFQVNGGVTLGVSNVVSGTGGLLKTQTGTLNLGNVNTYAGPTSITGTLSVTSLANGGLPSGIGQSSADAANLTINTGTFRYLGTTAATTDRAFTISGSSTFDASGSVGASVAFTNAAPVAITNPTTNAVTITLNGSNKDVNVFAPALGDALATGSGADAPVNLTKTGAGVWALPTANTFTGNVTVSNGQLIVRHGQALGLGTNAVSVIDPTGSTTPPSVVLDHPTGITVANNFRTSGSGSGGANPDGVGVIRSASGSNVLTGTLTLTAGGGFSTYTADAGSTLTFAGTITNDQARTLHAGGAGTGVISGALNNGPTGQAMSLDKRGTGTWLFSSTTSNFSGATTVNAGTFRVTGSVATSSGVTVNGGTFDAAATQTVKALNLNAGGTAVVSAGVLTVGDNVNVAPLTFGAGTAAGRLDLKTRGLIVEVPDGSDAAALTALRDQVISGYNAGTWTGNGVASSDAVASPSNRGVGYALASEVAAGGSFMGVPVDTSAAVARFTLLGDATLDGAVDFNDLVKLAQNYNTVDGSRVWFSGDFTYDGNTDFNDLVKLAQNYNSALPTDPIPGAPADFGADLAAAFAAVPEPGALSLLGVAGAALAGRRRRKANA